MPECSAIESPCVTTGTWCPESSSISTSSRFPVTSFPPFCSLHLLATIRSNAEFLLPYSFLSSLSFFLLLSGKYSSFFFFVCFSSSSMNTFNILFRFLLLLLPSLSLPSFLLLFVQRILKATDCEVTAWRSVRFSSSQVLPVYSFRSYLLSLFLSLFSLSHFFLFFPFSPSSASLYVYFGRIFI